MHCEICGGQIEIQANGKGMCMTCGTTYSIEYLRKLLCNNPTQSNRISPTNSNDFEIVAGTLKKYRGNSRRVIIPEGNCRLCIPEYVLFRIYTITNYPFINWRECIFRM